MGFGGWFFGALVLFSTFAFAEAPRYGAGYAAPAPGRMNNVPAPVYGPPAPVVAPRPAVRAAVVAERTEVRAAVVTTPVLAPNPPVAVIPPNANAIYQSFEQLIRFEVALLTESEIANATGVRFPADLAQRLKPGSWQETVYYTLLAPKDAPLPPEMMVFSAINQMKAYTLTLLGMWSIDPRNSPELATALAKVNNSYMNAMSAVRFYLWAVSGCRGNAQIYIGNIVRYMNNVHQTILFLRNDRSIQYQEPAAYADAGIAQIQSPAENKPYPIFIPKQTVNPQTKQEEPNYAEGEVIAPNPDALK